MASKANLNPGADATLVAAARAAAMANVPQDYSKAFNEIAKGYGKYAEGLGKIYKGLYDANAEAINKLADDVREYVGDKFKQFRSDMFNPDVDQMDYKQMSYELSESDQKIYDTYIQGMGKNTSEKYKSVKYIKKRQQQLKDFGFTDKDGNELVVDGNWGTKSKAAYEKYQSKKTELYKTPYSYQRSIDSRTGRMEEDLEAYNAAIEAGETTFETSLGMQDISTEEGKAAWEEMKREYAEDILEYQTLLDKSKLALTPITTGNVIAYENKNGQSVNLKIGLSKDMLLDLKQKHVAADKKYNESKKTVADKKIKDDEKTRINEIMATMEKSENKFGEVLVDAMDAIKNEDLLEQPLNGGMSLDFLRAAGRKGRKGEDGSFIKFGTDESGNKVILWLDEFGRSKINPATNKPFIATAEDMAGFLVKKDATVAASLYTSIVTDQIKSSAVPRATFKEHTTKRAVLKAINTKEKFLNAINDAEGQGNIEMSYVKSIYEGKMTEEMYVELNKLGGRFDNDGDNDVDKDDFVTQENLATLAQYLTTDSPDAREIFARVMVAEAETNFNEGVGRRNNTNTGRQRTVTETASRYMGIKIQKDYKSGYTVNNITSSLPKNWEVYKANAKGERDINGEYFGILRPDQSPVRNRGIKDPDAIKAILYQEQGILAQHQK